MDQTAEHIPSFDRHSGSPGPAVFGYRRARPSSIPMWSVGHGVSDVILEHSLEVPTSVDQDVVKALSAHGPNRTAPRMHSLEVSGLASG